MSKHTPGPWIATKHYIQAARGRDGHPGFSVADTQTFTSYGISDDERYANAHLITAAPALAIAWELVPNEVKQRIYDALHKPDTEWVESTINTLS